MKRGVGGGVAYHSNGRSQSSGFDLTHDGLFQTCRSIHVGDTPVKRVEATTGSCNLSINSWISSTSFDSAQNSVMPISGPVALRGHLPVLPVT